jgi:hypothetical protein
MQKLHQIPNYNQENFYDEHIQKAEGDEEKSALISIPRQDTPQECVQFLTQCVNMCKDMPYIAILIDAVGLKIDNRSSVYDLYYVKKCKKIFAIDVKDASFVATG